MAATTAEWRVDNYFALAKVEWRADDFAAKKVEWRVDDLAVMKAGWRVANYNEEG